MELRVARPLPRPDEHLRRPRQHRLPAAALRVARDRLRLRRRRARARRSTPAPTTSSTSAAARTATSAPSPPTWSRPSARRSPRRSTTAPSLLAVCGGYQLLGHSYQLGEERLPGLGLADLETVREPGPRLIGNVAIEADLGERPADDRRLREPRRPHLPRRRRHPARPGRSSGFGNNGDDGLEGVRRDNLIGTYLHGPLLPKNAWLADHLIALALERRYGSRPELEPLDDDLERAAARVAPRVGARCATECAARRFG